MRGNRVCPMTQQIERFSNVLPRHRPYITFESAFRVNSSQNKDSSLVKTNRKKMFRFYTGISDDEDDELSTSRFAVATDDQVQQMMRKKVSKNTVSSTNTSVKTLKNFLMETGQNDANLNDLTPAELRIILLLFYVECNITNP